MSFKFSSLVMLDVQDVHASGAVVLGSSTAPGDLFTWFVVPLHTVFTLGKGLAKKFFQGIH